MFFRNRQEKFPEEFRINGSSWNHRYILDLINQQQSDINHLQSELNKAQSELNYALEKINDLDVQLGEVKGPLDMDVIKDIILRVWRVNNKAELYKSNNNMDRIEKMIEANDDFDEHETKYLVKNIRNSLKPIKYVEKQSSSILKMFNENGFVIKDHTNAKYYDGMALNVLVFETDNTIEESVITETIKPSIFYKDELILNGEVVVATPETNN